MAKWRLSSCSSSTLRRAFGSLGTVASIRLMLLTMLRWLCWMLSSRARLILLSWAVRASRLRALTSRALRLRCSSQRAVWVCCDRVLWTVISENWWAQVARLSDRRNRHVSMDLMGMSVAAINTITTPMMTFIARMMPACSQSLLTLPSSIAMVSPASIAA